MKNLFKICLFLSLLTNFCLVSGQNKIPLVYNIEYSGRNYQEPEMPDMDKLPVIQTLPDPFAWANGKGRSIKFKDWEHRRFEIIRQLQHYELGIKPNVDKKNIKAQLVNDTLIVTVNENGQALRISAFIKYPSGNGPFPAIIGIGFGTGSLPPDIFDNRNIAQIAFNFTQVMSHTQKRGKEPINKLYPNLVEMGAYSAWPWGISRLIDGLEILGAKSKIDLKHIAVSGCSFAGKMALYAGAFDERIALTIAQEPGGGGVDAWRVSETLGHVETLGNTSHQWFKESMFRFAGNNVSRLPIDHHELAALICPRALLVLGNPDYEWLAEQSNYVSCCAARKVWETFGIADRMGFSIQGGHMHCALPDSQRPEVERFVDKFLLGRHDIDTQITKAELFKNIDFMKWMPWAK